MTPKWIMNMFGAAGQQKHVPAYDPCPEIISAKLIIAQQERDLASASKLIAGNNAYIERLHRDIDFWKGACEKLTWTINNPENKRKRRKNA